MRMETRPRNTDRSFNTYKSTSRPNRCSFNFENFITLYYGVLLFYFATIKMFCTIRKYNCRVFVYLTRIKKEKRNIDRKKKKCNLDELRRLCVEENWKRSPGSRRHHHRYTARNSSFADVTWRACDSSSIRRVPLYILYTRARNSSPIPFKVHLRVPQPAYMRYSHLLHTNTRTRPHANTAFYP